MANPLIRERRPDNDGYAAPLATLECTVERVTFHNGENGYSVVKVLPADVKDKVKADLITVIGNFNNPVVGESLLLKGTWGKHPQYGPQFKMDSYETLRPATAAAIEKYLGSGMVKGIGPVMAKRIVDKFGENALDVIEEKPEKLLKVSGLGAKRIDMIKAAWDEQREVRRIMLFLQGHGVTPTYAVKIYRFYKERAIEVVEKNPYQLATDIWGIGFKSADKIAQNIGIAPDAPERLEAGLIHVLNEQMEGGGHCYLPRQDLLQKACEILLPQSTPEGDEPADKESALRAAAIERALDALIEREMLVEETTSFLGATETAIYTPAIHTTEKAVAERINTLLNSPWRTRPKPGELDQVCEGVAGYDTLSEEQREAVRRALSEPLMVLTGGPGTGKTTTTRAIVAAFEKMGKRLQLASPTGRAAKRAAEVTGKEAKTIHRMLAFDPEKKGFKHGPGEPLELDVLVVDESSMLDLVLTHHTLRAVPDGAQVIFVGDVDQLPSVGPGNVLADLINSGRVPVARLTQVFRQAAASKIITNAHAINRGRMPDLLPPSAVRSEGADCVFLEVEESVDIPDKIAAVVSVSLPKLGFAPEQITVLTPMQRAATGAKNLNEVLQSVMNPPAPHKAEYQRGAVVFREGDRVMQRVNNYDKNVFNGDVGAILSIDKENQVVGVQYPEGPVEYDFVDMDQLNHALALTIHKCVAGYEPVATVGRGLVAIRDVRPGDVVQTGREGGRLVRSVFPTGERRVVRVRTKTGLQIDVSEEHPILVADSDSPTPRWVTAGQLAPGVIACIHRNVTQADAPVLLPPLSPGLGRQKDVAVPAVLDDETAYLLGALVGDGSYRDRKDGMVDFTNADPEVLARVEAALTRCGLRVCRYQPSGSLAARLYVVSRAFREWLCALGMGYVLSANKTVPPCVFTAPPPCRAAFLRGLFDTDGSVGRGTCRSVRLVTASEALARQVQQLLLSLGVVSHRAPTAAAWCVAVSGTSLRGFEERVGFTVGYKRERLTALLEQAGETGKTNHDALPFGKLLAALFRPHRRHLPRRLAASLSAIWNGRMRMSYRHLNGCIAALNEAGVPVPREAVAVSRTHYLYDPIVAVECLPYTVPMYDLEVEDVHSFVAGGGFVCHNSQGSEYPACIITIHTQHYMMLQRNLIYTALTRAKKLAVFVGSKRAIQMAVKNRNVVPRNTRLAQRLQQLVDDLHSSGLARPRGGKPARADVPTPPIPGRLF